MAIDNTLAALVQGTTTTAGTGPFVVSAVAGFRAFSAIPNGTEVTVTRWDSAGNYEQERVTVSTVGGVTTLTVVSGGRVATSNGGAGGAAVNWAGGGTQNVVAGPLGGETPQKSNNLSEFGVTSQGLTLIQQATAALQRNALELGSAALLTAGVAASNVVQLDGSAILPQLTGPLPAISGLTGGTSGKIVRYTSSGTLTDASNADTQAQLATLFFKVGSVYFRPGELVTGLSGFTAGTNYWLSTAGGLTTTPPTPGASVRQQFIGKAITTSTFHFTPGIPYGG